MRRALHADDIAREAALEAKRAEKFAKKKANMVAEQEAVAVHNAAQATSAAAGSSMEVDLPKLSKKQRIGVRKGRGSIRKPNYMMKKALKKLEKKRSMEF